MAAPPRLSVWIKRKAYGGREHPVGILRDMRIDAAAGTFTSLLGPSGCGKSTLLRLIAGLDTDYDGQVCMDGAAVEGPGLDIGVVFQESRLLPWMSVARNVAFALPECVARDERTARVRDALALVGLSGAGDRWPYQLSGGMEKRVGLARALVNLPGVLLMDEPFSAIDTTAKFALQDKVAEIHARERLTTILVTHDVDEAVYLSDRIALLSSHPATVLTVHEVGLPRPRSRTSAEFMSLKMRIVDDLLRRSGAAGPVTT